MKTKFFYWSVKVFLRSPKVPQRKFKVFLRRIEVSCEFLWFSLETQSFLKETLHSQGFSSGTIGFSGTIVRFPGENNILRKKTKPFLRKIRFSICHSTGFHRKTKLFSKRKTNFSWGKTFLIETNNFHRNFMGLLRSPKVFCREFNLLLKEPIFVLSDFRVC